MYTRAPWAHPVAARAESAPPEPTTAAAATGWLQTTAHGTMMPPPVGMPAPQAARAGGGTGMPRAGGIPQLGPPRARAAADQTTSGFAYAKATWDTYFDHRLSLVLTLPDLGGCTTEELPADETSFQIYTAGGLVPPDKNSSDRPSACASTSAVPVYVLLHGGGLSSLSWALVAGALKRQGRTILAYDFRGHVIEAVVGTQTPLVLVGHSLGGAIAAKVACTPQLRTQIHAIVMIDIVESVAMQSLDKMEAMLARRPPSFPTAHDAVQWATSSGMVNNPVSAAVSIPSLLRQAAVAHHQDQGARTPGTDAGSVVPAAAEEREEQAPLVWRTKLQSTAPLWPDWFEGMDAAFLSCGCGAIAGFQAEQSSATANTTTRRLLLLRSLDSLGKELTIAQMEGRIQVEPLPGRGHHLHEEDPYRVADVLLSLTKTLA